LKHLKRLKQLEQSRSVKLSSEWTDLVHTTGIRSELQPFQLCQPAGASIPPKPMMHFTLFLISPWIQNISESGKIFLTFP